MASRTELQNFSGKVLLVRSILFVSRDQPTKFNKEKKIEAMVISVIAAKGKRKC